MIKHYALSFNLANACSSAFSYWWAILSKFYRSWKSKPNQWDEGVNEWDEYKKAVKKILSWNRLDIPVRTPQSWQGALSTKTTLYFLLCGHLIFIPCRTLFNLQNTVRISLGTAADSCPIQQVPKSADLQ